MSFSSEIKEELSKINSLTNKKMVQAELEGYLISSNTYIVEKKVKYSTESQYNINRFSKLLNNVDILDYTIDLQGKSFVITFDKKEIENRIIIQNNEIFLSDVKEDEKYTRALIRGAFLGAGSMNNPENKYHLEISLNSNKNVKLIENKLDSVGIKIKVLKDKKIHALYIKEGEEISKFLAFIGASNAVLKFEDIRVLKETKNNVNRKVNCETANLNKTINASVAQIEAIEHLKEINKFEKLSPTLKEIAEVRLKYPNLPLSELGQFLKTPIGKSGVNYRLKKIIEISKEN